MTGQSKIAVLGTCALVLLFAVRCGGESERHHDPKPPPVRVPDPTPTAETLALAEAQCAYLERCDPDAMFLFAHESRAACEEFFTCRASHRMPNGLSVPSALEICLESLGTRDCPDLEEHPYERYSAQFDFPWGPACGQQPGFDPAPGPGAPELGERCLDEGERPDCAVGSYCVKDEKPFVGTFFCGTCVPFVELDAPCVSGDYCVEGAWCVSGRCRTIRARGEACEFDAECRSRACKESICGAPYAAPTPYADVVDGPCGDDVYECGNQAGLYCHSVVSRSEDGVCRAIPDEGEPCGASSGYWGCRHGQACVDGRCFTVGCSVDIGEPCSAFCESGDCVNSICVEVGGVGSPCEMSCRSLPCEDGICGGTPPPPRSENGASCDFNNDCESFFCERDVSEYCEAGSCSVQPCNGCGVCADRPTVDICPSP